MEHPDSPPRPKDLRHRTPPQIILRSGSILNGENLIDFNEQAPSRFSLPKGSPLRNHLHTSTSLEKVSDGPIFSPYLGLKARLSRAWATYLIVLVVCMAVRLLLHVGDVTDFAADLKDDMTRSCQAVERFGNTLLALPQDTAQSTNRMANTAALAVVERTAQGLSLAVTILEEVVVFLLSMIRALEICIADLVVQGSLALLNASIEQMQASVNSLLNKTVEGIKSQVNTVVDVTNKAIEAGNHIFDLALDKNSKIPTVEYPDTSEWKLKIPMAATAGVMSVMNQVPKLKDIQQELLDQVRQPFETLKTHINDSFSRIEVNATLVTVPEAQTITLCDDQPDSSVVDSVATAMHGILYVGAGLLLGIALMLIIINVLKIRWEHSQFVAFVKQFRERESYPFQVAQDTPAMITDLHTYVNRPIVSKINDLIHSRIRNHEKAHLVRWWVDYIVHVPSLACLAAGILGLVTIAIQVQSINQLRSTQTPAFADALDRFREGAMYDLTSEMNATSRNFADTVNGRLSGMELYVNQDLLGPIREGTTSMNRTVGIIINDTREAVTDIFGSTLFREPAMDFVNCAFLTKLESLGVVFDYLGDHATVALPRVDEDILVVGAKPLWKAITAFKEGLVGNYVGQDDEIRHLQRTTVYLPSKQYTQITDVLMTDYFHNSSLPVAQRHLQDVLFGSEDSSTSSEEGKGGVITKRGWVIDNSAKMQVTYPSPWVFPVLALREPPPDFGHFTKQPRSFPQSPSSLPHLLSPSSTTPSVQVPSATTNLAPQSLPSALALYSHDENVVDHRFQYRRQFSSNSSTSTPVPPWPTSGRFLQLVGPSDNQKAIKNLMNNTLEQVRPYSDRDLERALASGGYTGGLIGKLVDKYVRLLTSEYPFLIVLVSTWVIILIVGTVRVFGAWFIWRNVWEQC
ncbi:plasma membrane fusion protein prm1 [Dispira parvispora]|uniref:Plasma membrane fusion protein PRM1 n=1 Tax=Dispira parvispora TaxID=1520584 RepID=A0A9W8E1H3_9FUNG|nr:plasma membrane fusion protein prm1 [Dispira parvispora]